ncbi:MAG TPA: conjugal transfer protein TraI [Segetibacter sp.]|jgi:hypothetical protein
MKKFLLITIVACLGTAPSNKSLAQDPITLIIKEGIKKVIKAVDLQIQRQQNKIIWLQNAQKTLENAMAKTKLTEISSWVEKQRTLYRGYFDELQKVKSIISYYKRLKEITEKQIHLVGEYKRAYGLFKQDKWFTAKELSYMGRVYAGIIEESVKNIDGLFLVINSFTTQMSDAKRLEIINAAADQMDITYNDLKAFNQQGILLSLQRARAHNDVDVVRKLYGLK